jgi:hypothetical protein
MEVLLLTVVTCTETAADMALEICNVKTRSVLPLSASITVASAIEKSGASSGSRLKPMFDSFMRKNSREPQR